MILPTRSFRCHTLLRVCALQQGEHHLVHHLGVAIIDVQIASHADGLSPEDLVHHVIAVEEAGRLVVDPSLQCVSRRGRINAIVLHVDEVLHDAVTPQIASVRPHDLTLRLVQNVEVGNNLPRIASAEIRVRKIKPSREVSEVELSIIQSSGRIQSLMNLMHSDHVSAQILQSFLLQPEVNKHHRQVAVCVDHRIHHVHVRVHVVLRTARDHDEIARTDALHINVSQSDE